MLYICSEDYDTNTIEDYISGRVHTWWIGDPWPIDRAMQQISDNDEIIVHIKKHESRKHENYDRLYLTTAGGMCSDLPKSFSEWKLYVKLANGSYGDDFDGYIWNLENGQRIEASQINKSVLSRYKIS